MRRYARQLRLGSRAAHQRPRVLQVEPVAVPAAVREGPRLPQGRAGSTGTRSTRPCSRTSRCCRRHVRALRRRRRQEEAHPVVLQDHRLRRPAARRPEPARGHVAVARCIAMQRNWIGRSIGADVDFVIEGRDEHVTVFTTRPDTLYGATFMVVAPDSDLAAELAAGADARGAGRVRRLPRARCRRSTEIERQDAGPREDRRLPRPATRSTRSTASASRSGPPTTCSPTTATAPSWRFPRTTSATSTSPARSICRCASSSTRTRRSRVRSR